MKRILLLLITLWCYSSVSNAQDNKKKESADATANKTEAEKPKKTEKPKRIKKQGIYYYLYHGKYYQYQEIYAVPDRTW